MALVLHLPCGDNEASTRIKALVGLDAALTGAGNTSASLAAGPKLSLPQATVLDGTNDYINAGNPSWHSPAGSFTAGLWAFSSNWAASNAGMMASKSDGTATGTTFEIRTNGVTAVPQVLVGTGVAIGNVLGSGALTNSVWVHLVVTYDGAFIRMYKNGVLHGTPLAKTGVPTVTSESLAIGCRKPSVPEFFFGGGGGRVCDFRFDNVNAMSAAEVLAWFNETTPPSQSTLVSITSAIADLDSDVAALAGDVADVQSDLTEMDASLTDVKNVTDGFIGLEVENGSPAAAGSPAIAKRILEGERATICYLGDSITHDLLATVNRWWAGRCGIKGYGTYSRFNVIGTQSGVFTGDDTPNDWTDLDIGGGHWGKSVFGSGTSDASSTSSTNVIFAGRVGPPTGSSSINDGADWTPRSQRHALGFNWMNTVLATGDLKVRAAVRKTPNGAVGEHQFFVFKDGSTVRATSSFVSSYAASPTVEWVEATIPQGTTLTGGLTIEIRYRASTAGENTKETFWSSRFEVYDPTATTGSLVHSFGQSSTSIDDWNNTFSAEAASIFSVIRPDVLFIQLGTNNPNAYDATEFAAEIATLVAKIRAHSPDTTIVFVPIYGDPDVNPDYGGELGDEPYFTDGYFQAYQATSNSLFVNLGKLLPRVGSLVEPYPLQTAYPAWSDLTTGDFIQWHSIVEYGGNWYACKVGHAKGATNPSADTTNWVQLGAANSINQWQLNITNQNPMFRDGLHPHLGGAYLMMQATIDGLQIIRYSTTQQTIAMSIREELAPELTALPPNLIPGSAGGLLIAGSNEATTFSTLTSTGALTINGTGMVAQTGDGYALANGANGFAAIKAETAAIKPVTDALDPLLPATTIAAADDVEGITAASQPRINRKPDPGFTIEVSRRADGTYKCPKPIRLTAGAVQDVYVFINMAPLFGAENFVETVGTAEASAGSITPGDDKGPRDTYAVLELDGTADDDCEVTVTVTMTSGTTVPVVFDVEVLE
jgi:hypothetical protein